MDIKDSVISPAVVEEETGFEFSLRPKNLEEYIGQEKIKRNLSIFI